MQQLKKQPDGLALIEQAIAQVLPEFGLVLREIKEWGKHGRHAYADKIEEVLESLFTAVCDARAKQRQKESDAYWSQFEPKLEAPELEGDAGVGTDADTVRSLESETKPKISEPIDNSTTSGLLGRLGTGPLDGPEHAVIPSTMQHQKSTAYTTDLYNATGASGEEYQPPRPLTEISAR